MYRQVIKIWEEHSNDVIIVDRLQRIHTLENMADLLDADHGSVRNESHSVNTDQCADQNSTNTDQLSSNADQHSDADQGSSNTDQHSNVGQCSTNTDQCFIDVDQCSANTNQCSTNADQHSTNTDQSSTNNDQHSTDTDQCSSNTDQSTISKKPLRDEDLRSEVCYNNTKIKNFPSFVFPLQYVIVTVINYCRLRN